MSNIDKQAQREKFEAWAEEAGALPWGILKKHRNKDGSYPGPHYTYMWHAWSACHDALLDELEAEKERSEEFLRQARSFREAHESASEIIRKLERNKPTVKLPTTRLWAGKIACYEESEVVAMLEGAGISIAAGISKGE